MPSIVSEDKEILVEIENLHSGYQGLPKEQCEISFASTGERDGIIVLEKLRKKSAAFSKVFDESEVCFKKASKIDPSVHSEFGVESPIKNGTRLVCSLKPKNLLNSTFCGSRKLI